MRNELQRTRVNCRSPAAKPPPQVRIPHSPPVLEYDVLCRYGVEKETSANAVPELALFGRRVHQNRPARRVETHHPPLVGIVRRPSGRPTGGKRDPCLVHHI